MGKKISVLVLAAFVLAGCDTLGQTAGLGALIGAGTASAVGGDPVSGALIGGGAGAACYATHTCP